MKGLAILCFTLTFVFVLGKPQSKYTTKYDNVDLDQILKSDRLLRNYINCILEKGKCSPDGSELKRLLPDAIKSDCAKCSEKQKAGSRKVLKHLVKHQRQWFDELMVKFDPSGEYRKKYKSEYEKEGIVL